MVTHARTHLHERLGAATVCARDVIAVAVRGTQWPRSGRTSSGAVVAVRTAAAAVVRTGGGHDRRERARSPTPIRTHVAVFTDRGRGLGEGVKK
jgi:hypothetical protein